MCYKLGIAFTSVTVIHPNLLPFHPLLPIRPGRVWEILGVTGLGITGVTAVAGRARQARRLTSAARRSGGTSGPRGCQGARRVARPNTARRTPVAMVAVRYRPQRQKLGQASSFSNRTHRHLLGFHPDLSGVPRR